MHTGPRFVAFHLDADTLCCVRNLRWRQHWQLKPVSKNHPSPWSASSLPLLGNSHLFLPPAPALSTLDSFHFALSRQLPAIWPTWLHVWHLLVSVTYFNRSLSALLYHDESSSSPWRNETSCSVSASCSVINLSYSPMTKSLDSGCASFLIFSSQFLPDITTTFNLTA